MLLSRLRVPGSAKLSFVKPGSAVNSKIRKKLAAEQASQKAKGSAPRPQKDADILSGLTGGLIAFRPDHSITGHVMLVFIPGHDRICWANLPRAAKSFA